MTTEFNELLANAAVPQFGQPLPELPPVSDKLQIWLIGTREQVQHGINELYVKRVAPDRARFSPIVPFRWFPGKFISILER
jgi:hypothetical protein